MFFFTRAQLLPSTTSTTGTDPGLSTTNHIIIRDIRPFMSSIRLQIKIQNKAFAGNAVYQ